MNKITPKVFFLSLIWNTAYKLIVRTAEVVPVSFYINFMKNNEKTHPYLAFCLHSNLPFI